MSADFFSALAEGLKESAESAWSVTARPNQLPPAGLVWLIWLLLAGRGFGKTRTLTEDLRAQVECGAARRIAVVGATASDCRDVLVEGESGILAISPKWNRPEYEPSKRRLTWPNGAIATLYSADEPERLRGPQHDRAYCDELAAWRYPEAWDMLQLGLRLGTLPRCVVATTPKPVKLVRELLAREGKDVVVTRGSTLENRKNLAPSFIETIVARYGGTRLGRQEIEGELLQDVPGALFHLENFHQTRVLSAPQDLERVVVGVDPAGSSDDGANETGIVVAARGSDGNGYVTADLSGVMTPLEWASAAVNAYRTHSADLIVAERNFGGEMVAANIASVDPNVPVKLITSSRGKVLRAEPIASLFAQRRCHLVGSHPELEDQACRFTSDWDRAKDGSPDRVDAMVFALAELVIAPATGAFFDIAALLMPGDEEALLE